MPDAIRSSPSRPDDGRPSHAPRILVIWQDMGRGPSVVGSSPGVGLSGRDRNEQDLQINTSLYPSPFFSRQGSKTGTKPHTAPFIDGAPTSRSMN